MYQVIQCVTLKVKAEIDVSCIHRLFLSLIVALDDIVTALVPSLVNPHMKHVLSSNYTTLEEKHKLSKRNRHG